MANDFIPVKDAELGPFAINMAAAVGDSLTLYGISDAQNVALQNAMNAWTPAFDASLDADAAARAATATKDTARATLVAAIRACNASVQAFPACTDANKEIAGFPVYKTGRTPVPPPTTAPIVISAMPQAALHQVIEFRDQSTPSKRAKPAGVTGAEVWCKVGAPAPVDGTGCTFLGLDTRTPYLAEFDTEDSGKAVWYVLRWVSTTGQPGPWGPVFAAVVP